MKKIFCILSLLFVFLVPFFAVKNTYVSYAATSEPTHNEDIVYDNVYNYTANISTDYSTTFLNGIDSVESLELEYYTYYHYFFNVSQSIIFTIYTGKTGVDNTYQGHTSLVGLKLNVHSNIDYSKNYQGNTYNILLKGNFNLQTFSTINGYWYYRYTGNVTDIYVTDLFITSNSSSFIFDYVNATYYVTPRNLIIEDENLNQYLDLDSTTNYSFDPTDFYKSDIYVNDIFNFLDVGNSFTTGNMSEICSTCQIWTHNYSDSNLSNGNTFADFSSSLYYPTSGPYDVLAPRLEMSWTNKTSSNFYLTTGNYTIEKKLYISKFEMKINKPVNRLENTLVLYNYDYDCAISSVNSIEYALSKDNNLYKAKYTGSLPNNRYIGIVCSDLQNRIYDEYIYLNLTFNDSTLDCSDNGYFQLGFDFNFSRYYEPFVIRDNELSNYGVPTLNKPDDWWDIGGWIVYGFVWLIFYNPIISPVSRFINSIFSVFINTIQFVIGLPLGSFVLAFIGFIIIYNFFVSISPVRSAWRGIGVLDEEFDYLVYQNKNKKII